MTVLFTVLSCFVFCSDFMMNNMKGSFHNYGPYVCTNMGREKSFKIYGDELLA